MTKSRWLTLGVMLCAIAFVTSAQAAPKKKDIAGLDMIAGCAYQGEMPHCKVLGFRGVTYKLLDGQAIPGAVPLQKGVTLWGHKSTWGIGCFGPYFEVKFWARNRLACALKKKTN